MIARGLTVQGLRHHRPLGVGKGTLIRELLRPRPRARAVGLGDDPRAARRARRTGATTTSSTAEEFDRRVDAGDFLEYADLQRQPLRDAALRGRARGSTRGAPVVLEIEVQGARQVRAAMPEAVQVFIAPPEPADLRRRLEGRGTDSPEAIERAAARWPRRSSRRRTSSPTWSSTTTSSGQPRSWSGSCATSWR